MIEKLKSWWVRGVARGDFWPGINLAVEQFQVSIQVEYFSSSLFRSQATSNTYLTSSILGKLRTLRLLFSLDTRHTSTR